MTETKANGTGELWKYIAIALSSLFLGMMAQSIREPRDTVQEKELNERVLELNQKIDAQTKEIIALRSTVNQMSVDIASVAEKVGTTAHPVIVPNGD